MQARPLSDRELRQLAKLDRMLQRGRWHMALRGFLAGALGGGLFVLLMRLVSSGRGTTTLSPPTGNEAHPALEWAIYWLAGYLGPFGAFALVSALVFGGAFAVMGWGRLWNAMVGRHAWLAFHAEAHAQFKPAFRSQRH